MVFAFRTLLETFETLTPTLIRKNCLLQGQFQNMILHTTKLLKDYSLDFALTEQTNSYKDSMILKLSNNSIFNIMISLGQPHHRTSILL
jgi:hypothetical protein